MVSKQGRERRESPVPDPTRIRRLTAPGAIAVLIAGVALGVTGPAAQAGRPSRAVVSGDARFEVLSPTLIRTEYAPTGQFVDAGTFTAVGRDSFAPAHFTSRTAEGWLTIDTGSMKLRYRVGSGAFTPDN